MKRSKRYREIAKKVEHGKLYGLHEAVELYKEIATAKFDESIELHVRLGVDPRHADQQVRSTVSLPHGTGVTKKVLVLAAGEKIELYNKGENKRDFTYVDDVLESIEKLITLVPPVGIQGERYRIYNIGNNSPVDTKTFVAILMEELKSAGVIDEGLKFEDLTKLVDAAPGDVLMTYADIEKLYKDTGTRPHTELREGLARFAKWYKEYTAG